MGPRSNRQSGEGITTVAIASKRDVIASIGFVVFWVLPVLYVGLNDRSISPIVSVTPGNLKHNETFEFIENVENWLNNEYRVACLFTKAVRTWSNHYAQIQLAGENTWAEMDRDSYSAMTVFGYRTRISRMYSKASVKPDKYPWRAQRQKDIVAFIKNRYEELHPGEEVAAVRMVRVVYTVGYEGIASPPGHWEYPPLDTVEEIPKAVRLIKKEFRFDE